MQLAADAADTLSEFRSKRDSEDTDKERIHDLWMDTKRQIEQLFLDEDWELSDRTITKEVQKSLDPMSRPNEDDELETYFEEVVNELQTETTFTAYIYFPELVEMPVGKEIGRLEIIEKPEEKEHFMEQINLGFKGSEYYTELYEGRAWGKFEFDSYKRRAYIREELFDELQKVLGVLKVSIGKTSTPEELAAAIYNGDGYIWHLEPEHSPSGWTRYDERISEPTLSKLSDMLKKDSSNLTPLEENILGTIQLLTLHSQNYRNEHSFLSLIGALEGLLLTKYERPKAGRMAEKTVQLLYPNEGDTRYQHLDYTVTDKIDDYNKVKGWYQTRSEIIHGGYESVTSEKIRDLENTVEQVARKMVDLTDEYYSIQKQGGENNPYTGLNEMFLQKRLQTNLPDQQESEPNNGDD